MSRIKFPWSNFTLNCKIYIYINSGNLKIASSPGAFGKGGIRALIQLTPLDGVAETIVWIHHTFPHRSHRCHVCFSKGRKINSSEQRNTSRGWVLAPISNSWSMGSCHGLSPGVSVSNQVEPSPPLLTLGFCTWCEKVETFMIESRLKFLGKAVSIQMDFSSSGKGEL